MRVDRGTRVGRLLLLAVAAAVVVAAPVPHQGASASCAAPYLDLAGEQRRPVLPRRGELEVTGRAFVNGCDDTGTATAWGCSTDEGEVETPMRNVRLRIEQGSRSWELGEADAGAAGDDELGRVTWTVRLPEGLEPGRARLVADHAEPLPVRVAETGP